MSVQSASNDVSRVLWSVEEEESYAKAKEKANKYHKKINKIVSKIVTTPFYQAQYPTIVHKVKEYVALDKECSCDISGLVHEDRKEEKRAQKRQQNSLLWIKDKLFAEIKKERGQIDKKLVVNILDAIREIQKDDLARSCTSIDLSILEELAKALPPFLKENANIIFTVTNEPAPAGTDGEIDNLCKKINDALEFCSRNYLERQVNKLINYTPFLGIIEKAVVSTVACINPPPQLLLLDLGVSSFLLKEQVPKLCDKMLPLKERAIAAMNSENSSWKFKVAKEILNAEVDSKKPLTLPLMLDTFYVLSKDSCECPHFYKRLALKLCKKVNKFEIKGKDTETNGCTAM